MTSVAPFVHLHVHSDYSLSKGASKVADLVKEAARLGLPALALTDENAMYGAMEFSKAAAGAGVQPIIGAKLYFQLGEKQRGSFILLALSEQGYVNLCTILSMSHRPKSRTEGAPSGGEPYVDPELLQTGDIEGVVLLTGGTKDGVLYELLRAGKVQEARELLSFLRHCFNDRMYVEICRNSVLEAEEAALEDRLLDIAFDETLVVPCRDGINRAGVPIVATSEVFYATENRHDAYEILQAVDTKGSVSFSGREIVGGSSKRYHLRSGDEMRELFHDLPEAIENALSVARRSSFMVKGRDPILPPFETQGGRSEAEELRAQAFSGLEERLAQTGVPAERHDEYKERLAFELDVIERMGFPGYFLIVSDFMKWSIAQDIPVGPGRGSGAGSVAAWALRITDLDPLRFGLLFERFLNPERVSMPDFDIDFCQDRRGEVIRYVQQKYGVDRVSQIVTFMEIKSKTALKDVGRVITHDRFGGYGYGECDQLCKMIPKQEDSADPKKLLQAYQEVPEFKARIDESEKYRLLYDNSRLIEGLYRSAGAHAAGVIIGGQPLHTLVPVGWDDKADMPVTQFNMKAAEAAGLVKFDFLGLKTLSVIKEALDHIRIFHGKDIDISAIPLDDPAVYEMLSDGRANGVFQFESEGMKKVLRQMRPDRIEDLIAIVALYRPGPMDQIPHYADCKLGRAEPHYPDPVDKTKPFLEETYGIMVYQEQVMQVAQVVAGYSLGGADLLRRAMGKKIPAEMAKQREAFVKGAVERGTPRRDAEELFDHIAKFAGYGFNKSHAAAYALISYRTAWLKRHYPVAFFSALLSYETAKPERMALIKDDMDEMNIDMLPPDINRSFPRFRPEQKPNGEWAIRFGLTAIKQISGDLGGLVEARVKGGLFKSLEDFHARAGSVFNKGQIEKLAEAGAFDHLARNRYQAVTVLSWLAKAPKKASGQTDLFGGSAGIVVPDKISDVVEWGNVVDREFNAVGFYFANHPIDPYVPRLKKAGVRRKDSIHNWMIENRRPEMTKRKLCALVESCEKRLSRRGNPYISAVLSEKKDNYRVMFFGSADFDVEHIRAVLEGGKASRRPVVIVADLALEEGGEGLTIFGKEAWDVDEFLGDTRGAISIRLSPDAVIPTAEEARSLREIDEAQRRGTLPAGESDTRRAKVRESIFARKIAELKEYMKGIRNDTSTSAVPVSMVLPMNGADVTVSFEGLYLIPISTENAIKSMDGVISVSESA